MKINNIRELFNRGRVYFGDLLNLYPNMESTDVTVEAIREGIKFKGANIWILIFAVFTASLGLNTNSTAVIIGAMLISPLMGPIMGIGLGLGIDDFDLIKKSAKNLAIAALFSVMTSTLYFLLSPLNEARSELLARTSPTLYDVLIAFCGGAAGIVAISTKQKGNVIPGVAIATALMPPLCTAGFGLANGNMHYFVGALFLFLINSVFIAFSTTLGVKLMKFPKKHFLDKNRQIFVERIVYVILTATVVPSAFLTYNMVKESFFTTAAYNFVNKEFNTADIQVINKDIEFKNGKETIKVYIIGKELHDDSIRAIEARMPSQISSAKLVVSQGYTDKEGVDIMDVTNKTIDQIYSDNIRKIELLRRERDSLILHLNSYNEYVLLSKKIAPEAKVLFPQVKSIAIAKTAYNGIYVNEVDTITVAVISYDDGDVVDLIKFKEWMIARTGVEDIKIVKE